MNKYSQEYIITNGEMDINYRLKPISVIMYVQDCFARYMTYKHLAAFDIVDKNLYWIVSEFNIDFIKELPFWSEKIEVTAWISEISKIKIYVDFELSYNKETFAKGNSCWIILNSETKRPVTTEIITDKIEVCPDLAIGGHKTARTCKINEKIKEITHQTNLSDIDFNNHVNNKSYINIADSSSTQDFKESHIIKYLSVKFNKETYLGDTLVCSTYTTDKENTYIHEIEKDNVSVCEIITSWIDTKKHNQILDFDLDVRLE